MYQGEQPKENDMNVINATMLTEYFAETMSTAGYGISAQLFNALEEEFSATIEMAKEEGEYTSLDTFLGALEYAANHVYNTVV